MTNWIEDRSAMAARQRMATPGVYQKACHPGGSLRLNRAAKRTGK